jgi:hypothetical protein
MISVLPKLLRSAQLQRVGCLLAHAPSPLDAVFNLFLDLPPVLHNWRRTSSNSASPVSSTARASQLQALRIPASCP